MFTRGQLRMLAVWLGVPLALLILLFVINPAYEVMIFERIGPIAGMTMFIFLQICNAVTLVVGFLIINRWRARLDPNKKTLPRVATALLSLVTFIIFLAALWVALLYPSLIALLQTDFAG